ncbi:MAG: UvrD-helicase domain-containing protein [Bacteroidaceae bacterium]|nr:UvrD-helicase domain-containing protein [Bacteroidaceae bacterium]
MNNLKIYKASAGSGKTFTLAVEYIRLVIINPEDYRHILAVTFTNKATNEMKERIIYTLSKIANHDPDAIHYVEKIKENLPVPNHTKREVWTDEIIAQRAQIALTYILHDYSRFRIETIDSFFQSIIRNLAHELSLTANLRVDLNQDEVLSEAVKDIIDNLQVNHDMLFAVISQFIEEKIEDSRNWKITKDVEQFGKNIFSEIFLSKERDLSKLFHDENFFGNYRSKLQSLKKEKEKEIQDIVDKFFTLCNNLGCNSPDFFYKKSSGPYSFFTKLQRKDYSAPSNTTLQCIAGELPFARDGIVAKNESQFRAIFTEANDTLTTNTLIINSASLICQHISQMRLLSAINNKVRELNVSANRFLLADTAHFLHSLINDSDIPFIYEKSGTWFKHIMIDEFQDTSALQWENFKPLLKNSIDAGKMCLIVGDVKQSIYRFRNTDWEILNSLGRHRGSVAQNGNEFLSSEITVQSLDTNHRSAGNIICFNNELFENIRQGTQYPEIVTAYDDVQQKIINRNKDRGYVSVKALDEESYQDNTYKELASLIINLNQTGVSKEDITLLLRTNKEISDISTYFASSYPELKIVSEEAYRLNSSIAVNIIIHALHYLDSPNDRLTLATLLYIYAYSGKYRKTDSLPERILNIDTADLFVMTLEEMQQLLPEPFYKSRSGLTTKPLHELCHIIYNHFALKDIADQDAYVMFFLDKLTEYVTANDASIEQFITYWDEKLSIANIPSGSVDGIRAMTIHKSKGLEFHTVICPFCSWKTSGRNDTIMWCEPTQTPFSELPLTAISYNKKALDSIFQGDYDKETMKTTIDNLNLLYVAFTRAKENLFIFTLNKKGQTVADILLKHMPEFMKWNDDSMSYEFGTLEPSDDCADTSSHIPLPFIDRINNLTFRQSDKSMQFIGSLDDDNETPSNTYLHQGLIIHRYFELIHTPEDEQTVLEILEEEGSFENETFKNEIIEIIHKAFRNPEVQKWYDPHWTEMKECTIIYRDENSNHVERRPDKVIYDDKETIVIDYKTGGRRPEHEVQVRNYMDLLSSMGYHNVKGFLWYITSSKAQNAIVVV